MKFTDYPYKRPDCQAILDKLDKLGDDFLKADTFDAQLEIYKQSEEIGKEFGTQTTIAHVRYTINTKDEFYKSECEYYDTQKPLYSEKALKISQAILNSAFLKEFEDELGYVAIRNLKLDARSFSSAVVELCQKENELIKQYQVLYASAKVEFDGKTLPLPLLGPYKNSPDRSVRKSAYEVEGKFFDDNQTELDEIYDKLVANRTEQAKILGYNNFVELAYDRRHRNCFDAKDVANYRKQILEEVVPIVNKTKQAQKARIGIDDMKFYDETFLFTDGNPTPQGTPDELLASCRKMYNEMSPETAEFIEFMFENELFDVLSKDGKAPGGYCTKISEYKAPFIFSNFNGTAGDVDVLTHEAGHALHTYLSSRNMKYSTQMSPTHDACEVHSMAMEYLTSPWHELFFKQDTTKYTLDQAESNLSFLPYGTMVDYFQELVYQNPDWTPAQRNEKWAELEKQFRPHIDFDNLPFYGRGAGWQRQLHIYLYPFYYIDYCLALTVALQIQAMKLKDFDKAWSTYLTFTKMSGTKTFIDLVTSSGLQSPMETGCLKSITDVIADWLFSMKL